MLVGPETPQVGAKVGNIRLLELLGRGGMGDVYVGFDERLERKVALKGLRHDRLESPAARLRFRREARLLSQLNHPNICQIYDLVAGEDRDFLVLELVDGKTLRQAMDEGLDAASRMHVALEIANALVAAHGAGVIHRDLKPENVMLTPDGRVKVLDFGLALSAHPDTPAEAASGPPGDGDERATGDSRWVGTPLFMSPEQASGGAVTMASDLYSFGILLHQLFTGRSAYGGELPLSQLMLRVARAMTQPAEGVDPDLAALLERLTSLAPAARPTAVDTRERLLWIRDAPKRRRKRWLIGAVITVLALFTTGLAIQSRLLAHAVEHAEGQTRLALSRHLMSETQAFEGRQLDLALLFAVEAHRFADTLESRSTLHAVVWAKPRLSRVIRAGELVSDVAPSPDGKLLAVAGGNGQVAVWDLATGRLRGHLEGHRALVTSVAWSDDGEVLASGDRDGKLFLWDAAGGEPLGEARTASATGGVGRLVWHGAGAARVLASAGGDGTVRLWSATGEPLGVFTGEAAMVAVDRHRDGRLAALDSGGTVWLWEAPGRVLGAPRRVASLGAATDLAFGPDGRLAIAGTDGTAVLLEASGRPAASFEAHQRPGRSIAWSPDGRLLTTASVDKTLRLWDAATGEPLDEPWQGHDDELTRVVWSADGKTLFSAGLDGLVLVWDVSPTWLPGQALAAHDDWVIAAATSPDRRLLAAGGAGGRVGLWELRTGRPAVPLPDLGPGSPGDLWSLAWSHDGRLLAAGYSDGTVRLWDAPSGRPLHGPLAVHGETVRDLAWSPGDDLLASAGQDGVVRLLDVASGRLRGRAFKTGESPALGVDFQSGGGLLVAVAAGGVWLWDLSTGEERAHFSDRTASLALHPDGTLLAAGGADGSVEVWELPSCRPLGAPWSGHRGTVWSLAWSGDGRLLASGGADQSVVVWEVPSGRPLVRLGGHQGMVLDLAWSGRTLVSASSDHTVRRHDLSGGPDAWRARACRRAGRDLESDEWELYVGPEVPYHATCSSLLADGSDGEG